MKQLLKKMSSKSTSFRVFSYFILACYVIPLSAQSSQELPEITAQQAKALKMLNQKESNTKQIKNLRLQVRKLSDNQGQTYLGTLVSRAELLPYITELKGVLSDDFERYRANQAARDRQTFHLTLINPNEYQHIDKKLVEQLLSATTNINFSSQLQVKLLGLGKVEKSGKRSYFIVAQSNDAVLIRQRFLLPHKDFHITLGFNPSDIYGVKKDKTTLL